MKNVFCFLLATLFAGCATTKTVVEPDLPALVLKEAITRRTTQGLTAAITLPAGVYRTAFRDKGGIYYKPENPIILLGQIAPLAYVFVSDIDSRKHAFWTAGNAIVDWFESPIPFEISATK